MMKISTTIILFLLLQACLFGNQVVSNQESNLFYTDIYGKQKPAYAISISKSHLTLKYGKTIAIHQLWTLQPKTEKIKKNSANKTKVTLQNGGAFNVSNMNIKDGRLECEASFKCPAIAKKHLSYIPFQNTKDLPSSSQTKIQELISSQRESDVLFAWGKGKNAFAIQGEITTMNKDHVFFIYKSKERKVKRENVIALFFKQAEITKPEQRVTLTTIHNDTLVGDDLKLKKNMVSLNLANQTIELPLNKISIIRMNSPKIKLLSTLSPSHQQQKAIIAPLFPWQKNRSTTGKEIKIGKSIHSSGLGTHGQCHLQFNIPEKANKFITTVGLEPGYENLGNCLIKIELDGKEVVEKQLHNGKKQFDLEIDLKNSKSIHLITLAGKNFDIGDHVNWGSPRFILD